MKSFFNKQSILYFKGYLQTVGLAGMISLIYRKFISSVFLKRRFNSCNTLLLMKDHQISGGKYIHIEKLSAGKSFRIEAIGKFYATSYTPNLRIGNNVSFGHSVHIGCIESIEIGNNVLGGSNILILDHDHGDYSSNPEVASHPQSIPAQRVLTSKPIVIGDNVFIGEYVCILKGVKIGEGSVIAANSVVTKSFLPNTLIAGNPAREIKRFDLNTKSWIKTKKND